jgi:hypothetical protein
MSPQAKLHRARFETAADQGFWKAWMRVRGKHAAGNILFAALDAAVGKLSVSDADHARKMFLQALRRRGSR